MIELPPYVDRRRVDYDNAYEKDTGQPWDDALRAMRASGRRTLRLAPGVHPMRPRDRITGLRTSAEAPFALLGGMAVLDYGVRPDEYADDIWDRSLGITVPHVWLEGVTVQNCTYGCWTQAPYVHYQDVLVRDSHFDAFKTKPEDQGRVSFVVRGERVGTCRPYFGSTYPAGKKGSMAHMVYCDGQFGDEPQGQYRFIDVRGDLVQGWLVRLSNHPYGADSPARRSSFAAGFLEARNCRGLINLDIGVSDSVVDEAQVVYDLDPRDRARFGDNDGSEFPAHWRGPYVEDRIYVPAKPPRLIFIRNSWDNVFANIRADFAPHVRRVDFLAGFAEGPYGYRGTETNLFRHIRLSDGPTYFYSWNRTSGSAIAVDRRARRSRDLAFMGDVEIVE